MPINFPDSPTTGDTHTIGDKTWTYDGTAWNVVTSSGSDHGNLGGLADDDHTQYALADGSRGTFETSGAVSTHEAAADPHTQYLLADGTRSVSGDLTVNGALDATGLVETGNINVRGDGMDDPQIIIDPNDGLGVIRRGSGYFEIYAINDAETGYDDLTLNGNVTIDGSGNVGIGTTSPSQPLTVQGNAIVQGGDLTVNAGGNAILNRAGATTSTDAGGIEFQIDGTTYASLHQPSAGVLSTGANVGIGTTSPATNLHISSGTAGDAELRISADTDNNDESDLPYISMTADGGIIEGVIGLNDNTLVLANSVSSSRGIDFRIGTSNYYGTASEVIANTTSQMFIDTSGNVNIAGETSSNSIRTDNPSYTASMSAPRWDCSFYVLQSQHWYGQDGSQRMYLGEAGNTIDCRGYFDATGIFASSTVTSANYFYTYGGTQQTLIGGTNGQGAIYLGTGVGTSGTGGIEATWRNTTNPSISIGVVRDGDKTRMDFNYNGDSAWYVDNTTRVYCNTGGVYVYGTFTNSSSITMKENVRDASLLQGVTPTDTQETLDRWSLLRPRAFDWKEKPMDKWWVGCDTHDNRFECEAAGCENDRVDRIEHVCGKGWCYGTEEDPCPRYRGVRDRVHFIAEEVQEIIGDHVISFDEGRNVVGIDMQAFNTEHVHVTKTLIDYVRGLERRIAELETVNP